jgi:peptidoglycan glycosyltransferase
VVQGGTGTAAQIPGVAVAGKTGTAQTGRDTSHTWFVSFAPAGNPKVAVAVIVEDQPNVNEATGGVIAAPIAKTVLQAALAMP